MRYYILCKYLPSLKSFLAFKITYCVIALQACAFVRDIYVGFIGVSNPGNREFLRKLSVLRQSLSKMEMACYTLAVRGNEIPKHMLADVFSSSDVHEEGGDEGFCVD